MTDYSKVPWLKVHDYLLQVGSCRTIPEFMRTACAEVGNLIPFDAGAGIFCAHDAKILASIGPCESVNVSYNNYYRTRQPALASGKLKIADHWNVVLGPVINWREHTNLEYAVDFMIPSGFSKSLGIAFPKMQISLALQRSGLSPDFTDKDATILGLLNQHLNNYWALLVEGQAAKNGAPEESGLQSVREKASCLGLTQREQEVALLLSERLSMSEIADRLFISRRTVEKHVENIYGKLGIRKKQEVGEHLLGIRSYSASV